ncbi:response regulator [Isoptericola sp. NPDC056605]|uniref:response regulator transcription factor n=1 Tax=Isoptericola sp. NPDC056605 TaxID=3345876 RepID=UPI0036C6CA44
MTAAPRTLRVAVVEDEAMVRGLVLALLRGQPGIEVVADAAGQRAALDAIRPAEADVALLDIELEDGNGIALGRALQERDPALRILLVSSHNLLALVRSISAAAPTAWSYLSKRSSAQPGELVRAVTAVGKGRVVIDPALVSRSVPRSDTPLALLSVAQFRVLQLVAEGRGNGRVAAELGITPKAVEAHLTSVYKRLDLPDGANNRVAAVLEFLRQSVRPGA